jgi:uncharacterized protein (DUF1697 family)
MNKKIRKRLQEMLEIIEGLNEEIQLDIIDNLNDKIENMPENLQSSQRAEDWQLAVDTLEEIHDDLSNAVDKLHEME